jgi:hypothetical protein
MAFGQTGLPVLVILHVLRATALILVCKEGSKLFVGNILVLAVRVADEILLRVRPRAFDRIPDHHHRANVGIERDDLIDQIGIHRRITRGRFSADLWKI